MTNANLALDEQPKLFGHPAGLFTLFFAEMWERFSYYGMRALLVLYLVGGFMKADDTQAYKIYGAYTALVYMTPFIGGMIADKLIGARASVILGGILMSLGHLIMTQETEIMLYVALGFLIVGNGFFKPNISTMVGELYKPGDTSRRSGFTIFYMGINLGAALSPLLCGYIGQTYGWHYGFGLATIGMLIGLAVFWAPTLIAQGLIGAGAISTAGLMIWTQADKHWVLLTLYAAVSIALLISAGVACVALARGGLPEGVGAAPEGASKSRTTLVYVLSFATVPVFAAFVGLSRTKKLISQDWLDSMAASESSLSQLVGKLAGEMSTPAGLILAVSGVLALTYLLKECFKMEVVQRQRMYVALILCFFSMLFWALFEQAGGSMNLFADRNVDRSMPERIVTADDIGTTITFRSALAPKGADDALMELPPLTQAQLGVPLTSASTQDKIGTATRLFEASKSKVKPSELEAKADEINGLVESLASQETFTMTALTKLRTVTTEGVDGEATEAGGSSGGEKVGSAYKDADPDAPKAEAEAEAEAEASLAPAALFAGLTGDPNASIEASLADVQTVDLTITQEHVDLKMGVGGDELPASMFQSFNAIFILTFGLLFAWLWGFLRARNFEPSTPVKFALGLAQLGLGFVALWYGAENADSRGMVGIAWLTLAYLLHTTGELCLSPVGLSMITELSPKRLVSTMMGTWFLATAFSNYLAAIIGTFTSAGGHGGGEASGEQVIPAPVDTLSNYSEVYYTIGIGGLIAGGVCLLMSPLLKKWMHIDAPPND